MSLFITALVMGFFSGGHCLGMCGPLVLALPAADAKHGAAILYRVLYNLGRIFTYCLLGAITGLTGAALSLKGFQSYLSYFAGSLLIFVALMQLVPLIEIRWLNAVQASLRSALTRLAGRSGAIRFSLLGAANGLLPCGMVAIAVMASFAAGSVTDGVLYMLFFGLGTFPLMLEASLFGIYLNPRLRKLLAIVGPLYAIALGILLLLRPGLILPDCAH